MRKGNAKCTNKGSVRAGATSLLLGSSDLYSNKYTFPGSVDELRISNVARSEAWVKATYDTVANPAFATYSTSAGTLSGYGAWMNAKELVGKPEAKTANGIENAIRYAFDIAPESSGFGAPIMEIGANAAGGLAVKLRALAKNRSDVAYGVLASESLDDWTNATFVPYSQFTDGTLTPSAVKNPAPAQMFFKYSIAIQQ